jgi:hypothetical protein
MKELLNPSGREQRIGSPHVQEEGDGLTRYLELDPGLSEGDWGPQVKALSIFCQSEKVRDLDSWWC